MIFYAVFIKFCCISVTVDREVAIRTDEPIPDKTITTWKIGLSNFSNTANAMGIVSSATPKKQFTDCTAAWYTF